MANSAFPGQALIEPSRRIQLSLHTPGLTANAGNAFWTTAALTAWDAGHWEFVKDVVGDVFGIVALPHTISATPNAKIILELAANATTGVTTMGVATKAVADGESLNPSSLTAESDIDVTVPATAYLRKEVQFSLTETVAADDILIVRVRHNGTAGNDTLAVNTLLLAAYFQVDL